MALKTRECSRLRTAGLLAPPTTLVAPSTPLAAVTEQLVAFVASECSAFGALLVEDDADDGAVEDDGDDGDDDESEACRVQLCAEWPRRAARIVEHVRQRRGGAPRAVCVRGDPSNGRIGLLLRRCPSLLVYTGVTSASAPSVLAAHLRGSAPPPPSAPTPPSKHQQHLEETGGAACAGAELVRCGASTGVDWELPLLWSFGKIYCARWHGGGGGEPFPAFDDDADAWAKVRWRSSDAARLLSPALDAARELGGDGGGMAGAGGVVVRVEVEVCFGPPAETAARDDRAECRAVAVAREADVEEPSEVRAVYVVGVRRLSSYGSR